MADVKVPPLLHKMSLASQKAWYKKHGMEMPSAPAAGGKSAAQAKKDVGEINKQKAKEKSALQKALETSPKQKELKKSSARVQQMAANALAFGGQRPGGDLTTARGIVSYIRGGGYLKAGRLGEEAVDEAVVKTKDVNKQKLKNYVRGLGTQAVVAGKVPFDQRFSPLRAGRKVLKQEEVEHIDEVTKKEAEAVIGGPVKEKPKMAPGKQPAGYRYVRGLARKAMKAGLKKEEVEQVVEQDDSMEKKEMAETQLHFIGYAAKEILEFIKMGGEIEEWYQNKLSKVQSEVESLHSYIEGEKRRTGMVEEIEQADEAIRVVDRWYPGTPHDNQKRKDVAATVRKIRKDPDARGGMTGFNKYQDFFGGRNARLGAERTPVGEEIEQIDEAFDKSSPAHAKAQELVSNYGNRSAARAVYHGDGSATIHTTGDKKVSSATRVDHIHDQAGLGYNRSAEAYKNSSKSKGGLKFKTKETEGKSIYGSHEIHISHNGMKEEVEQIDEQSPAEIKAKYYHDQFNKVKPVKAYDKEGKLVGHYRSMAHAKQMKPGHTYKEVKEEVVTEAEGKVAVTPKEKDLAAHHGDKTRITYGDVIKARLKSVAAKKMGKQ